MGLLLPSRRMETAEEDSQCPLHHVRRDTSLPTGTTSLRSLGGIYFLSGLRSMVGVAWSVSHGRCRMVGVALRLFSREFIVRTLMDTQPVLPLGCETEYERPMTYALCQL